MYKRWIGFLLSILVLTGGATAQTAVTTSGGNTNYIPLFTGSATIGNSEITQSGGNVGIGTTAPDAKLAVSGGFIDVSTNSGQYSLTQVDAATSPIVNNGIGALFAGDNILRGYWGVSVDLNNGSQGDAGAASQTRIPGTSSFTINSRNSASTFQTLFTVRNSGNVGIGTTAPGAKLEVNGNLKLTSGSGASITFQDGTVQSTAYTGVTCGGDYAETVDVAGSRTAYEPGDIMVLAKENRADVVKSSEPYSTMVAGIYSTKPGVIGRRQTTDPKASTTEIPMAMVGIVPAKVSAENGPIQRGDLLVSSSTPGYAMKGTDRGRMFGAVVGKAMGNLDSGIGLVEVLVTLQ